jgi:alpha-tubulin suppressor-like RCC1 family protein
LNQDGQCDVSGWTDVLAVAAGDRHTVGLRSNGTVVAVGYNGYNQCDVSGWKDIRVGNRTNA